MIKTHSKEWNEINYRTERELKSLLYEISKEENMRHGFVRDSKLIQDSIREIAEVMARIKTETKQKYSDAEFKNIQRTRNFLETVRLEDE